MFGSCEICQGSRTIILPIYRMSVTGGPSEYGLDMPLSDSGNSRRYPCPECTKPLTPPDIRDRYSILRANKLARTDYMNDPKYVDAMEGNLAALIGRVMRDRGLITFTRSRMPELDPRNNTAMEACAGAVWPKGEERDREIYDLDPTPARREQQRAAPLERKRTPGLRELIFDDEKPPDG